MNKLFIIFILFTILFAGCGMLESTYDEANYESITNETGKIVLWSGGKVMAIFHDAKVKYSAADSDAMFFTAEKGSKIALRDENGDMYSVIGDGGEWYSSPGVLMKVD